MRSSEINFTTVKASETPKASAPLTKAANTSQNTNSNSSPNRAAIYNQFALSSPAAFGNTKAALDARLAKANQNEATAMDAIKKLQDDALAAKAVNAAQQLGSAVQP